eukprot:Tamp_05763.p4 GENE.Tamp_05763~~Tamp_05763.p4  ORF type:complete len:104 (+),score=5.47 Tamp_05763:1578-1889(+)
MKASGSESERRPPCIETSGGLLHTSRTQRDARASNSIGKSHCTISVPAPRLVSFRCWRSTCHLSPSGEPKKVQLNKDASVGSDDLRYSSQAWPEKHKYHHDEC